MTESRTEYQVNGVDDLNDLLITANAYEAFCTLHPDVNPDNGLIKDFVVRVKAFIGEYAEMKSELETLKSEETK